MTVTETNNNNIIPTTTNNNMKLASKMCMNRCLVCFRLVKNTKGNRTTTFHDLNSLFTNPNNSLVKHKRRTIGECLFEALKCSVPLLTKTSLHLSKICDNCYRHVCMIDFHLKSARDLQELMENKLVKSSQLVKRTQMVVQGIDLNSKDSRPSNMNVLTKITPISSTITRRQQNSPAAAHCLTKPNFSQIEYLINQHQSLEANNTNNINSLNNNHHNHHSQEQPEVSRRRKRKNGNPSRLGMKDLIEAAAAVDFNNNNCNYSNNGIEEYKSKGAKNKLQKIVATTVATTEVVAVVNVNNKENDNNLIINGIKNEQQLQHNNNKEQMDKYHDLESFNEIEGNIDDIGIDETNTNNNGDSESDEEGEGDDCDGDGEESINGDNNNVSIENEENMHHQLTCAIKQATLLKRRRLEMINNSNGNNGKIKVFKNKNESLLVGSNNKIGNKKLNLKGNSIMYDENSSNSSMLHLQKTNNNFISPSLSSSPDNNNTNNNPHFNYNHNNSHNSMLTTKHACEVCKKTFKTQNILRQHMRIHTGDKPFVCDICNKAFSQMASLKYHLATHSDARPYRCECCSKTFKLKPPFKKHIKECQPKLLLNMMAAGQSNSGNNGLLLAQEGTNNFGFYKSEVEEDDDEECIDGIE